MAEPSSVAMAKLFTDLVGHRVSFSERLYPVATANKQIYGVYVIKPMDSIHVIQADALLLASFAGALIGLSSNLIKERMAAPGLDEALNDALREIMNIASRVVTLEHRAVFKGIYSDPGSLRADARKTVRNPCYSSYFDVLIEGYEGGALSLLAPM